MIPNITRGGNMAELLRYLYGPGKANEHDQPRLVASSQHAATLAKPLGEVLSKGEVNAHIKERANYLEESRRVHEKSVKRWLNEKGEVVSKDTRGAQRKAANVWHCSLSLAGPALTDTQKAEILKTYNVGSLARLSDAQWQEVSRSWTAQAIGELTPKQRASTLLSVGVKSVKQLTVEQLDQLASEFRLRPPERLTDEQFGAVATRYAELMGFNGSGEFHDTLAAHPELEEPLSNLKGWEQRKDRMNFGAVRWDAANHGLNSEGLTHIHMAAEVVSENGNVWEDVYDEKRAQIAAGIIEREFGLRLVDGHQHERGQQGYKKGQLEHDYRMGRDVGDMVRGRGGTQFIDKATARPQYGAQRLLERTMRACAVAAGDELDYVRLLRHEGIEIQHSEYDRGRGRGRVTGYQVRLEGDGERWFAGGKIAKDVALPALRAAGDWPRLEGNQVARWSDAEKRTLTPPDYTTVVEAEAELAQLRQRLTEVDVTDRVTWAHVARDASGMLNAISLRTEPKPGPLSEAAYAIAASATINRTAGDRRRWLGRSATRTAARALMAQRPARSSRELMRQVSYMVRQMTEMHVLAAQEQRAREVELRAYDALEDWLEQHPVALAPADHGWVDHDLDAGDELER